MIKIAILINLLFFSCSTSKTVDMDTSNTIEVNFHQVICQGVGPQWCYQIKENGEKDWTFFYDEIEGFNFEWGTNYILKIKKEKIENPPADGSSLKWVLASIVKKERIKTGSSFNLAIVNELIEFDKKNHKVNILGKSFNLSNSLTNNQLQPLYNLKFVQQKSGELEIVEIE